MKAKRVEFPEVREGWECYECGHISLSPPHGSGMGCKKHPGVTQYRVWVFGRDGQGGYLFRRPYIHQ